MKKAEMEVKIEATNGNKRISNPSSYSFFFIPSFFFWGEWWGIESSAWCMLRVCCAIIPPVPKNSFSKLKSGGGGIVFGNQANSPSKQNIRGEISLP